MRGAVRVLVIVASLGVCASGYAQVDIEWVTVGDPGNAPDTEVMTTDGTTGYGSVGYIYEISKFEITNSQYVEFLNAVAASDPNGFRGLYDPRMASGWNDIGGIERSGSDGSYTYSVRGDRGDRPVGYIDFFDALRFVNWMHNGQPTGPQDASTTEDGAYDLSLGLDVVRKPDARFALPSEDEWYKAAFYKSGGVDAGYWDYPTRSDLPPVSEPPPGSDPNIAAANYAIDDVYVDTEYWVTKVGAYTTRPSAGPYGTFDQGGNVREWNESSYEDGARRGIRGSSFYGEQSALHAGSRGSSYVTTENANTGFRVVRIDVPVEIEWVTVGDPGNAPDTEVMTTDGTTGYGSVGYTYEIGKYEITNYQYVDFLNAVAASDTNGLYNVDMASGWNDIGGIVRSGSDGSYTYSARGDRGNRPVGYISFYDALRFVNWMHNGRPTGPQDASTTEDGAYDLSLGLDVVRKPGAKFALPSEDEWYKAAFYKGGGLDAGYWDYPTRSDLPPVSEAPPGSDPNVASANFVVDGVYVDTEYWVTKVGSYTTRPSVGPYGTFDQAGNIREWNESSHEDGERRGIRGSSFYGEQSVLHAGSRGSSYVTVEYANTGFRIVRVDVPVGIEWVTVGDPGNAPDTEVMITDGTTGYGSVWYTYEIGKYEITNNQYAEFLNAVAASDTNGLYNLNMASGWNDIGGIVRSGSDGSYTYSARGDRGNRPVGYISFYDALRFVNWMHNGRPTGPQDASTTEDGAYDLSLGLDVVRKPGAKFALPSEDEWYKAAFYKGGGLDAGYWDYPTQSDSPPVSEPPPGSDPNVASANFVVGGVYVDTEYWVTEVGAYATHPSAGPYGTFDQAGNIREWNESSHEDGARRGMRGSSFYGDESVLHAGSRGSADATIENANGGFRIARIVPMTPCPGDVDGNRVVDLSDLGVVLAAFFYCQGNPLYDAAADFDQTGCIDLTDLGILLNHYGDVCP